MRRLTPQELVDRYADMGSLGSEVEHLPWANLRVVHEHRYPALKVWPKLRSFHAGMPDAWSKIAWRPLGDYSKHHWRKPLSMVGKWATHTVRTLGWGWGKEDPRAVVERIHAYNGVRRARMLGLEIRCRGGGLLQNCCSNHERGTGVRDGLLALEWQL